MKNKLAPLLKVDWASHDAAKYACLKFHYSKAIPVPPLVKIGVWEDNKFIGCVIFSRGANNNLLKPYGLKQSEGCELTRIALTSHATPVSRIVRIAIKFLLKNSPALRLIVSFADPEQGHHGGVYQAGNRLYVGRTSPDTKYFHNGKRLHSRQVSQRGYNIQQGKKRLCYKPSQCEIVKTEGKHRYLFPLDKIMADKLKPLSKPYPKRVTSIYGDAPEHPSGQSGSSPTATLQNSAIAI